MVELYVHCTTNLCLSMVHTCISTVIRVLILVPQTQIFVENMVCSLKSWSELKTQVLGLLKQENIT